MPSSSHSNDPADSTDFVFAKSLGDSALLEFVDRAVAILKSIPDCENAFNEELSWLERRREIWTNHAWRLALIGITSSGKSTLVNALMGEKLLPARIPPSSNIFVLCRRSAQEQTACRITYKDGRNPADIPAEEIADTIKQLGDEQNNPENLRNIGEIHLSSQKFAFTEDVVLIDTPGLDAYGLERHEKLTLEFLLPTIDLVIFLVTLKSNASAELHRFLTMIRGHRKPLVLVQTAVDSVEAKLGVDGVVLKSKAEVRSEHRRSATKLLSKAGFLPEETPVVQISALRQLQGYPGSSGISDLVDAVEQYTSSLVPEMVKGRFHQLGAELDQILRSLGEQEDPMKARLEVERTKKTLTRLRKNEKLIESQLEQEVDKVISLTRGRFTRMQTAAENLRRGEKDREAASEIIDNFEAVVREGNEAFGETVRKWNRSLNKLALRLNLRSEDIISYKVPARKAASIGIPTSRKRVKDRDFFAPVRRFFGFGDARTVERLKRREFRASLSAAMEEHIGWMRNEGKLLIIENAAEKGDVIRSELNRRERLALRQHNATLTQEAMLRAGRELTALRADMLQFQQASSNATSVREPEKQEPALRALEISGLTHAIIRSASRTVATRRLLIRNKALARVEQRIGDKPATRCLVFGFDQDSIERFLHYFWSDFPNQPHEPNLAFSLLGGKGAIEVLATYYHKEESRTEEDFAKAGDFLSMPATIFLFVDLEQIGSAMNQVKRSALAQFDGKTHGLILVIQCVQGMVNARSLAEGMLYLRTVFDEHYPYLTVDAILANSGDTMITLTADTIFERGHQISTLSEEQELVEALSSSRAENAFRLSELLSGLREYRNNVKK